MTLNPLFLLLPPTQLLLLLLLPLCMLRACKL
jgi:hypothetical protein